MSHVFAVIVERYTKSESLSVWGNRRSYHSYIGWNIAPY